MVGQPRMGQDLLSQTFPTISTGSKSPPILRIKDQIIYLYYVYPLKLRSFSSIIIWSSQKKFAWNAIVIYKNNMPSPPETSINTEFII
ncbi:hypothetical protein TNCT_266601 [Trichonephila clavata]|uniref:Uncharacterized protein n=1 Tax=Trichonephila clavata TaxID=2740835 RepID=A0A8X6KUR5_TRICU|nr:hypothetical protein TNCT_266601 [Trichonephila clavata]